MNRRISNHRNQLPSLDLHALDHTDTHFIPWDANGHRNSLIGCSCSTEKVRFASHFFIAFIAGAGAAALAFIAFFIALAFIAFIAFMAAIVEVE